MPGIYGRFAESLESMNSLIFPAARSDYPESDHIRLICSAAGCICNPNSSLLFALRFWMYMDCEDGRMKQRIGHPAALYINRIRSDSTVVEGVCMQELGEGSLHLL